jgi:hypothetical protein
MLAARSRMALSTTNRPVWSKKTQSTTVKHQSYSTLLQVVNEQWSIGDNVAKLNILP